MISASQSSLTTHHIVYGSHPSALSSGLNERDELISIAFSSADVDSCGTSHSEIFVHDCNTMTMRQMTHNLSKSSVNPSIVPPLHTSEDILCFLRGGQLWCMLTTGGEPHQVTSFPKDILYYKIFRGTENQIWLLFAMETDITQSFDKTLTAKHNSSYQIYDRLMVRQWNKWMGPSTLRNHLFLCSMDISPYGLFVVSRDEKVVDLMQGMDVDCPGRGLRNGSADIAISPNGEHIVFCCQTVESNSSSEGSTIHYSMPTSMAWKTRTSLYMLKVPQRLRDCNTSGGNVTYSSIMDNASALADGNKISDLCITNITSVPSVDSATKGLSSSAMTDEVYHGYHDTPAFSNDCKLLAYLSRRRDGYESDQRVIHIYDMEKRESISLTHDVDIAFRSLVWGYSETVSHNSTDNNNNNSNEWLVNIESKYNNSNSGLHSYVHSLYILYTTAIHHGASRIFKLTCLRSKMNAQDTASNDDNNSTFPQTHFKLLYIEVMSGDESRMSLIWGPTVNYGVSSEVLYFWESSFCQPPTLKRVLLKKELLLDVSQAPNHSHVQTNKSKNKVFVPFVCTSFNIDNYFGEKPVAVTGCSANIYEVYCSKPQISNGDINLSNATQHYFRGAGGEAVHAWYIPAVNATSESEPKSVPLVLVVHGGPQGAVMNNWNLQCNLNIFASRGYSVLAVNFHGSCGFDQAFTDSIHNDWGGKPLQDCLLGIDYITDLYSYIDPARIGAIGTSYGGYMMNWINGNSDRFRCLVNHAGLFNLKHFYFSTEELWFPEWEFGLPWSNINNNYDKWSPDACIVKWKTPMLVIHGGKDYRVSDTHGISTFTALQRKGIPSKFLHFPEEGHHVNNPNNLVVWYDTILSWLDEWLL